MKSRFKNRNWYPNTIAICSGVVLYVFLTNLPAINGALKSVRGYFSAVLLGCVIAYTINPLARFYQKILPIHSDKTRWEISAFAALITVIAAFMMLLLTIIPQLIASAELFVSNLDSYAASLEKLIDGLHIEGLGNLQELIDSWADYLGAFITQNIDKILSTSADIGKGAVNFGIATILSIYLLLEKAHLKEQSLRLMNALLSEEQTAKLLQFFRRCDSILVRYISCSVLESFIVGFANAMFMNICGMEYIGLISVIVAVFNLIPTFGPLIGGVLGAFVLVLIKPSHALLFLIFTIILQTIDGYIIKPKLFGSTLGVSGLLILISVIVCGNMFGVVGILLAIPIAAIVDFMYSELLLPMLEKRRREKEVQENVSNQP